MPHKMRSLATILALLVAATARAESPPAAAAPAAKPADAPLAEGNVVLKVSAKGSGIPVAKAEVKIGGKLLFSDPTGLVRIEVPAAGDGSVRVSRKGFVTIDIPFSELRPPGEFDVRLYPGQPDDDVIVVKGTKNTSISRTTVSIEEASKVAPGGDPAQVVKLLPGVSTGRGTDVIVQGSGPHDSRYFVDDMEVPFIFHSFGNLSVIPGDLLASVDFESAGFGTEYGDATGGIITLRTKNEIPERPKTEFIFNIPFYSGILYTRPLSETESLTVGIRRSYIDVFLREYLAQRNKHSKDPSTNVTLSPYFSDGEVQYLRKNEDGHTKVTLLGAYDGIEAVVPTSQFANANGQADINFYTGFADLGVEHERRLDRDWKLLTTPQLYFYQQKVNINEISANNTDSTVRVPTHFTRRLDKNDSLYLGIDPNYSVAKTDVYAPLIQANDPTFDREEAPLVRSVDTETYASVASWAAIDQSFGPATVTPGVRAFYNGQTKKSGADPRIRAKYALTDDHTLKAAFGQYSESPQPLEASATRGNPNLDFIRAMHYVLGLETKWNEEWTSEFTVYYKTAVDTVQSDPTKKYNNDGSLRSRGFETFIRRNMTGRLFGWLSYTYSKTEERPDASAAWRTATYDQTNVIALVGDYKFTGTWDVGGRYDYHTGSTYNIIDHSAFNADLDKYDPRPSPNEINAGRLPPTQTVTAYFNHDFLYDTWKLSMRFGMEEYWPSPQVSQVQYNFNYSKADNVTSLTSIPFFELKGEI